LSENDLWQPLYFSPKSPMMMGTEIVQQIIDAWNSHDIERIMELHDCSYEGGDVGLAEKVLGLQGIRKAYLRFFRAFPDIVVVAEDSIVCDNRVVLHWVATGTHRGVFMRIPASNKKISVHGVSLLTLKNGKILKGTRVWDMAGLLREIGLLPDLQE